MPKLMSKLTNGVSKVYKSEGFGKANKDCHFQRK